VTNTTKGFFASQTEESKVKAEIVTKFFDAWCNVILGYQKKKRQKLAIGYVDLFAGPGRYDDGSQSTPLLVLEKALERDERAKALVSVFNEPNTEYHRRLEGNIKSLPGGERLEHEAIFMSRTVDTDYSPFLKQVSGIPTLFFVDPWGYKGVSIDLLRSAVRSGWGRDLILFFNYRRICAGVSNQVFAERMKGIFGSRYEAIRTQVETLHGDERENAITAAVAEELAENAAEHVLKFRIERKSASHYLFFLSKNARGRQIMADIMAGVSSDQEEDVASFEFTNRPKQASLFPSTVDPIEELATAILRHCAGKTLTTAQIFDYCTFPGKNYRLKNYKQAQLRLEQQNAIITSPAAEQRKGGTFGDNVLVTFPGGGG
jgi:three-Cys-motif partner protein